MLLGAHASLARCCCRRSEGMRPTPPVACCSVHTLHLLVAAVAASRIAAHAARRVLLGADASLRSANAQSEFVDGSTGFCACFDISTDESSFDLMPKDEKGN